MAVAVARANGESGRRRRRLVDARVTKETAEAGLGLGLGWAWIWACGDVV